MVFHGSTSSLSTLIYQPGMQGVLGEGLNRILVTPEGAARRLRSDISERDLLDVNADVRRAYEVDRDRVFAGGYSQGGYLAYRRATCTPTVSPARHWVGFTGDDTNGSPAQGSVSYTREQSATGSTSSASTCSRCRRR